MSNINQMANIEVKINGEEARDEIEKLQESAMVLRDKIVELNKRSKETGQDLCKEIKAVEREYAQTQKTIRELQKTSTNLAEAMANLDKLSPKELQKTIKAITKELNSGHVKRGTKEWEALAKALQKVKKELQTVQTDFKESDSRSGRIASWGRKWMGIVTTVESALETASAINAKIQEAVQSYADMQESMSQVTKYTGMSAEEVEQLNNQFKEMDTRTPRERLNELAGDAGKLGITSQEAVLEFVDAADKINVALGEDLGEDAVKNIGKLAQMFGEDERMGLRGAMLATGSAINEVAQNSSASEAYLVDFTARVAGAAKQANISQADIIGFASVLDENMLRDETAATAFQNILVKMFQEPAKFAKLAGKNVQDFTLTMKTDAKEGVMQFIEAMSQKGGLAELAPMFEQMKLDGQGAASVLAVMADKVEDIRKRQQLANQAYTDGTSIIDEFNVQNNTVQAGLEKAKKRFNDLKVELGEKLMPIMQGGLSLTSITISIINSLISFVSKYIKTILGTIVVIKTYTAIVARSITVDELKILMSNKVATALKAVKAAAISATKVIKANPFLTLAAAIGMATIALHDYLSASKKVDESAKAISDIKRNAAAQAAEEIDKIKSLREAAMDENSAINKRKEAIRQLNEIVPGYNATIDETTGKYIESKAALDDYLTSLQKRYELEGAKDFLKDLGKKRAELLMSQNEAIEKQDSLQKDYDHIQNKYDNATGWERLSGGLGWKVRSAKNAIWKNKQELTNIGNQLDAIEKQTNKIKKVYKDINGLGIDTKGENRILDATKKEIENIDNKLKNKKINLVQYKDLKYEIEKKSIEDRMKLYDQNHSRYKKLLKEKEDLEKSFMNGSSTVTSGGHNEQSNEREERIKEEEKRLMLELKLLYANGIIDYEEYCNRKQNIENESIQQRMALYNEGDSKYRAILNEKERLETNRAKQKQAWSLQLIDEETKQKTVHLKKQLTLGKISEEEYARQSEDILLSSLKKKAEYIRKWGSPDEANKAELKFENQKEKTRLDREIRFLEGIKKLKQKYLHISAEEQMKHELAILDKMHKEGLLKEEVYQPLKAKIRKNGQDEIKKDSDAKTSEILSEAGYQELTTSTSSSDLANSIIGMGQWAAHLKQAEQAIDRIKEMETAGVISHEEATKAIEEIDKNRFANFVSGAQAAYAVANALANTAKDFMQASMNAEIAKIEERYARETEAAGKNSEQAAKIEEKKKADIAQIKNKYNKKAMGIEIAQAVASTAMATINAYSSAAQVPFVGYILAPIAAAAATAAGMLQIATIKKQHEVQNKGYASGGFTRKGRKYDVAGFVHAGEFVANAEAVNNPNVYPLLSFIDQAQRNNTIGTLTAKDISRVVTAPTIAASTQHSSTTVQVTESEDTKAVLAQLNERLQNPIRAQVVIDGVDGLDYQYNRFKKLKNRA